MYHTDFSETNLEDDNLDLSQEDKKFLKIMKEQSIKSDGHYELPLPFRNPNVYMPNNREQAIKRARWTKRRLQKDLKFHNDYVKFMNEIIAKGYARKVEENCDIPGKQWYIPHHRVYHPKKPEKIRVVFDCSTQYEGTSLNKELLQGPDLTNQLVGVLLRFRKELIAFTGDIEAMFYQVRVPENQRSYLRFLWWPEGNLEMEPIDYEMCVHLFGGISSPSCSNYALRRTADDSEDEFGSEAAMILKRNFYVDDMLKSKECSTSSIALISNIRKMCASGGFNLMKFSSNDKEVLESIPQEERSREVKKCDLAVDNLPAERALGVCWCVENDSLGFRIELKDKPFTRRGILSFISSVYDPLGLAAPYLFFFLYIQYKSLQ